MQICFLGRTPGWEGGGFKKGGIDSLRSDCRAQYGSECCSVAASLVAVVSLAEIKMAEFSKLPLKLVTNPPGTRRGR